MTEHTSIWLYPPTPEPEQQGPADGPKEPHRGKLKTRAAVAAGALAIAAGAGIIGYGLHPDVVAGKPVLAGSAAGLPTTTDPGTGGQSGNGSTGNGGTGNGNTGGSQYPGSGFPGYFPGGGYPGSGSSGSGGYPSGGYPGSGSSGSSGSSSTQASTTQQVGVVDIDTVLGYQGGEAAGTGMVLTADGEILTNNHVVNGATKITVTVVSTGKTYTASVVGTDPTEDVAVLQLQNASGLQVAKIGDSGNVKQGDKVTAVGNAGGVGGTPSAVSGSITAIGQTITASDENGANPETLDGLFETDAQIEPGDSGGPLYAADGTIIGIDTAAQTGRGGSTIVGYAIPIDHAEQIAGEIEAGHSSDTIHIGATPFLGVSLSDTAGAQVSDTVQGGPAETAGITAGDTITAIGGKTVTTADEVHAALLTHQPGDRVKITWRDQQGSTRSATVTLATGPAD